MGKTGHQHHVDRNLYVGSPGGVDRERASATPGPKPRPDRIAIEQQRGGRSARVRRPRSARQQRPMRDADGRQVEDRAEVHGETRAAGVISAGGIDQQDFGQNL
jgi:hypothetical protein